ncbi:MAG TPA: PQQ-binding-like beta-propeller repeat protein, partial [Acidimicrobiales bacterium]|nr:PQQ-binding-like beta-propeller repeat protein [Acidimicrobiales bacterium]
VAIQSGGASGPWWDGATGTWTPGFSDNLGTLASPGTPSSAWSYSLPVSSAGGRFSVFASSVQGNGLADVTDLSATPGAALDSFAVRNAAGTPHVYTTGGPWVAPAGAISVAASGFSAGETVNFDFGGQKVGSAKASSSGNVTATPVTLPKTAPFGPAAIVATGATSGRTGAAPIYVANGWAGSGNGPLHGDAEPNDRIFINTISPGPPDFLAPAWSYPDGAAIDGAPAISKDVAYFGDAAGVVTALNVRNSQPLWSVTEAGAVDSSPAISGSDVVFGTSADSVVALAQSNGSKVWSTATSSPVESPPAVAGSRVYVGSDNGTVYALGAAKGTVVWSTKVAGAVKGSPAVDTTAGLVIVGDSTGVVTALSATTGAVRWRFTTGGAVAGSATIAGGDVYLGSADGSAYSLNESTGAKLWSTATPAAITAGGVYFDSTVKAGTLYVVGSSDGTVTYMTQATGAVVSTTKLGGAIVGIAGTNGWITATTASGGLYGMKRTGELEWVTSTGGFASAPVIVDGVVFTTGTDQTVRAFTVPGTPIP